MARLAAPSLNTDGIWGTAGRRAWGGGGSEPTASPPTPGMVEQEQGVQNRDPASGTWASPPTSSSQTAGGSPEGTQETISHSSCYTLPCSLVPHKGEETPSPPTAPLWLHPWPHATGSHPQGHPLPQAPSTLFCASTPPGRLLLIPLRPDGDGRHPAESATFRRGHRQVRGICWVPTGSPCGIDLCILKSHSAQGRHSRNARSGNDLPALQPERVRLPGDVL